MTSETPLPSPADVVRFWRDAGPERWFARDDAFDVRFREAFASAHAAAASGELDSWGESAEGALALLLLLDQYPRNAFRGTARMFDTDTLALTLAKGAVDRQLDAQVDSALRLFFYLPFMHAERVEDQRRCVTLCTPLGSDALRYAQIHLDVIERFGRFPHRNVLLGRSTTAEEQQFLDEGGFSG